MRQEDIKLKNYLNDPQREYLEIGIQSVFNYRKDHVNG